MTCQRFAKESDGVPDLRVTPARCSVGTGENGNNIKVWPVRSERLGSSLIGSNWQVGMWQNEVDAGVIIFDDQGHGMPLGRRCVSTFKI